jgi:hypothetical protein
MTPAEACFLRDAVIRVVERETPGTRRLIAAIPRDRLDWRPHEGVFGASADQRPSSR